MNTSPLCLWRCQRRSMKRTSSHLYQEFITIDSGSTGDKVPDPNLFVRAVDQAKVLQQNSGVQRRRRRRRREETQTVKSVHVLLRLPELSIDYARRDWIRSESTESPRTNDNKAEIASKSEDLRRACMEQRDTMRTKMTWTTTTTMMRSRGNGQGSALRCRTLVGLGYWLCHSITMRLFGLRIASALIVRRGMSHDSRMRGCWRVFGGTCQPSDLPI